MGLNNRGAVGIASAIASPRYICLSCRRTMASSSTRRQHAVATAGQPPPSPAPPPPISTFAPPNAQPAYTIKAGVLLSRPPLLTPDPHPFETAYHLYQRRLNERLVLPFSQYFYYQRDTPAFERWRAARRARNGVAARDVGGYNAYDREAWNDEALVGDWSGDGETIAKQLIKEEGRGAEFTGDRLAQADMAGLRRKTEADERGETRSLQRALTRTLYLLVRKPRTNGKEGGFWSFPSGTLEWREGLREAAERILYSSCGPNMNTWFIGNHPVGHYVYKVKNKARLAQLTQPVTSPSSPQAAAVVPAEEAPTTTTTTANTSQTLPPPSSLPPPVGEKTFFMKSRIFKGQANPTGNEMGVEDFQWLSKEEIQREVSPQYWAAIQNILQEQ